MKVSEVLEAVAGRLELDNEGKLLDRNVFKPGEERKYLVSACRIRALSKETRGILNDRGAVEDLRNAAKQIKLMEMLDAPTESTK
ncbi:hypothetical protein VPMG_00032 [Vibrio phage VBP32]|uniref:Uncharacterized protein n=2 Tax=Stoningtonvirus VBP47 TaxID=2846606 RepID=M4SP98_9CAUD|nr:hypothetical protein VPNG_00096 [Vibrio phage VBP47]YP_007676522.1 hypothetical protein VPMG_00032 [Vibrio phage VBP32]AGH57120.1 hypothetical protein VPNG_00096 [Vibrio phage VBP47]AGH57171.1 hypothetical protein VPMG_00032 [Vibrio phage VBP32]